MKFSDFMKKYNIGYIFLSLVCAFLLWLIVVNIQDPEITKTIQNIPVIIKNESMIPDKEYVYTVASGSTTSVRVKGNRSIVDTLTASSFQATADFAELSKTNAVPINVELAGKAAQYIDKLELEVKTRSMIINLEQMRTKSMKVQIEYVGKFADNMVIDSAAVTPEYIDVTAPESILGTIDSVTAIVNCIDVTNGAVVKLTPRMIDLDGKTVQPSDTVYMEYKDDVYAEFGVTYTKTVEVSFTPSAILAENCTVDGVDLSFNLVTIKGVKEIVDNINKVLVPTSVADLSKATKDVVVEVDLTDYAPSGVVIYGGNRQLTITIHISEHKPEVPTDEDGNPIEFETDEEGNPIIPETESDLEENSEDTAETTQP